MTDTPLIPCSITPANPEIQISPRVSHALHQLAGPWSEQIAELFPFPHSDFLNRSSMWMHVAGLILANPISADRNVRVVFDHYKDWRDAAFVGSPRFTRQNVCVLKKMTLPLWSREDYRLFTPLLDCERAVKIMKHSDHITPDLVRMIAHLPDQFRTAKISETLMHSDEAKLLFRMFNDRGEDDKKRIVSSLKGTKNRAAFWRNIGKHYFHSFAEFQCVIEIDDDRFESIRTIRRLLEVAKKYENCCDNYVGDCITRKNGFFVFHATETAIISYKPLMGNGYYIDEIQGPKNQPVSDEIIKEIEDVVSNYGFIWRSVDPAQAFRLIDNRFYRLSAAEHDIDSINAAKTIGELLDEVDVMKLGS